ncbi:hypothetical protein [Methylobacterium sp.]|uniref:hypothetical protein n=1 Tax=Methylobacterium sp. TaxID=409 RepID=UPI003B015E29
MSIYNDEGPEQIRGAIWLTVLFLAVVYGAINAFVPNSDMNIAVGVLQAAAATMVVYIYGRDAWIAMRTKSPKRTDFLIVGIVLAWLSTDGQAILAVVFRLAGMPAWFVNSEIYAPIRLLSVVAAVLHVSAPGAVDGLVPRKNRIAMGLGLGGAVLLVLALLWSRPDIGPLLERTRPYISDFFQTGSTEVPGASPT